MKSVLISIRPEWCYEIANGYKTVEVRKTCPKLDMPFKCYIYCTNKYPLIAFAERFDYRFGRFETEVSLIEGYGRKVADGLFDLFNGHVIGEFTCDRVDTLVHCQSTEGVEPPRLCIRDEQFRYKPIESLLSASGLSLKELEDYLKGRIGYGWHISALEVYDTPKELSVFTTLRRTKFGYEPNRIERAPQSWCYVEEMEDET